MQSRTELVVYVLTFALTGSFFVFLLVVGILHDSSVASSYWKLYTGGNLALNSLTILLLVVLAGLSTAGFVVIRRKRGISSELRALMKLIVVAALLLVAQAFKFSLFVMKQREFTEVVSDVEPKTKSKLTCFVFRLECSFLSGTTGLSCDALLRHCRPQFYFTWFAKCFCFCFID